MLYTCITTFKGEEVNDLISPIKKKKVSELVLEKMKEFIQDGTFPADEKLPSETELAKMFNVSRAPVREALSVLTATGIVESRQGGGNWVRRVDLTNFLEEVSLQMVDIEQVYDLLEMRTIIETEAAALAAIRHKEEDIVELEKALHAFGEKMLGDQTSIGDEADYHFHHLIVKATYNPFIIQSIENIAHLYQKAMTFSLQKNVGLKMKRESVYKEHEGIFLAIKNRDPKQAATKMKEHLQTARKKLGDPRLNREES